MGTPILFIFSLLDQVTFPSESAVAAANFICEMVLYERRRYGVCMKRIGQWLAFLLFALCFTLSAAAQAVQVKHILLWRVDSGDSIVYLLGSVHVAKPDLYPLNGYIESAFSGSTRLVVEVDVRNIEQVSLQKKILTFGVLPQGRTLRGELDARDAKRLEEKLSALGVPVDSFDRFRPWVVYSVLAELDFSRLGYEAANGVDVHFLGRAGDREVVELESADLQLELMAGFSDQEQRELLVEYLDESGKLEEEWGSLFDAWLSGDDGRVGEILATEIHDTQLDRRVEEILLKKRDAAMAEKIEGLLKRPGASFVVVGAAHLFGKGSVVDILKQGGYAVTIVKE